MFWVVYRFCDALPCLLGSQSGDEPICNFGNTTFANGVVAKIRGVYLPKYNRRYCKVSAVKVRLKRLGKTQ